MKGKCLIFVYNDFLMSKLMLSFPILLTSRALETSGDGSLPA